MDRKYYRYTGPGEVGEILPGIGLVSKEPLQARDETHEAAILASGVYKPTAAPKKTEDKADDGKDGG